MSDLAGEQQLLLEAPLQHARSVGIGGDFRANDLQRDNDAELLVPGLVDGAHAAHAELPDDLIAAAEGIAGGDWFGPRLAPERRPLAQARRVGIRLFTRLGLVGIRLFARLGLGTSTTQNRCT